MYVNQNRHKKIQKQFKLSLCRPQRCSPTTSGKKNVGRFYYLGKCPCQRTIKSQFKKKYVFTQYSIYLHCCLNSNGLIVEKFNERFNAVEEHQKSMSNQVKNISQNVEVKNIWLKSNPRIIKK